MWGIGERLGNLVQGRGFRTNVEYAAGQLEEEKKRREAPAVSIPTVQQPIRATVPSTTQSQPESVFKVPTLQVAKPSTVGVTDFEAESARKNPAGPWSPAVLERSKDVRTNEEIMRSGANKVSRGIEDEANRVAVANSFLGGIAKGAEGLIRLPQTATEGVSLLDESLSRLGAGFLTKDDRNRLSGFANWQRGVGDTVTGATGVSRAVDEYERGQDTALRTIAEQQGFRNEPITGANEFTKALMTGADVTGQLADPLAVVSASAKGVSLLRSLRSGSSIARTQADEVLQVAAKPEAELGAMGDGTISPNRAQAVKEQAQVRADELNAQANQLEVQARQIEQAPTVVPQPEVQAQPVLQQPERLVPFDEAGPIRLEPSPFDEPVAPRPLDETQATLTEQQLAPSPEAPVPEQVTPATRLESESTAESRAMVENAVPVATEPVPGVPATGNAADVDNLGDIARQSVIDGSISNKTDAELYQRIETAAAERAERDGLDWEAISKKVQDANARNLTLNEARLTPQEYDLYQRVSSEMNFLRERAGINLEKAGNQPFYLPKQANNTEYDPTLVNERARSKDSGVAADDVDYSFEPSAQYIRRYTDASENIKNQVTDLFENTRSADGKVEPTGVVVPDAIKSEIKTATDDYLNSVDEITRAADKGDTEAIARLTREADDKLMAAFGKAVNGIKDQPGSGKAVRNLKDARKGYMQSTIRTNMFLNVVNRVFDQIGKGIVQSTDRVGIKAALRVAGDKIGDSAFATNKQAWKIANDDSKGALTATIGRQFRNNVALARATAKTPAGKFFATVDALYRAGGTALTGLGDMTRNSKRLANMAILERGQAQGITKNADLKAFLKREQSKPEYQDVLANAENVYAGYASMPRIRTAAEKGDNAAIRIMSKIDNGIRLLGEKYGFNKRVMSELNDLVMPSATGFAAAAARSGAKQLNALGLGIYGWKKGLKIAQSGEPGSKELGQMIMARSLIDGVSGAGFLGAGAVMGGMGMWTGSYPSDPNEQARWEKEGITENALRIPLPNGQTLQIQPGRVFGPMALPVVLPVVIGSAIRNGEDVGDAVSQVLDGTIGQFAENMGGEAITRTISNAHGLVFGNDQDKARASKDLMNAAGFSIGNAVTPAAGLANNLANLTDDTRRDTSGGIPDYIMSRNPVTRPMLDPKLDNLGNPVRNKAQFSGGSQAITVASDNPEQSTTASVMDKELSRLAKEGFETMPAKDVKNTGSTNDAEFVVGTDWYKNATDEEKAEVLSDTLKGTRFKDINQELDDTSRATLMEGKLMTEGQRSKWLENMTTSRDYNVAQYENAIANDTLTSKDDDLQEKSGLKYKSVASQVNLAAGADANLLNKYNQITKKEFEAMSDDNPLKAKLWALDQARKNAGVSDNGSDTSLSKYGDDASGAGGSSKAKLTISTPSITSGSGSGSGSSQKYIGINRSAGTAVPQVAKAKPKARRSISVTRGVKL